MAPTPQLLLVWLALGRGARAELGNWLPHEPSGVLQAGAAEQGTQYGVVLSELKEQAEVANCPLCNDLLPKDAQSQPGLLDQACRNVLGPLSDLKFGDDQEKSWKVAICRGPCNVTEACADTRVVLRSFNEMAAGLNVCYNPWCIQRYAFCTLSEDECPGCDQHGLPEGGGSDTFPATFINDVKQAQQETTTQRGKQARLVLQALRSMDSMDSMDSMKAQDGGYLCRRKELRHMSPDSESPF